MTRKSGFVAVAVAFLAGASCAWAAGGPDAGGYTWLDSNDPGGPAFAFAAIATNNVVTGVTPLSTTDDQFSNAINFGFTFNFYGVNQTQVFVSSNGFLCFNTLDSGCCTGQLIPSNAGFPNPNDFIAVNWNDLNGPNPPAVPSNTISSQTTGIAPNRIFTVEMAGRNHFGGANPCTVQVQLFETSNDIVMQLQTATADLGSPTQIGIENSSGTVGLNYNPGGANPTIPAAGAAITNTAVRFRLTHPAAVTDLARTGSTTTSITLGWTNPGNLGTLGTATTADLRFSATPIVTQADYNAATPVAPAAVPGAGGTANTYTVNGLTEGRTFFFAIEYVNSLGNRSLLSNVVQASTLNIPPSAVADLACGLDTATTAQLNWTHSGNDGMVGTATTANLRFSFTPIVTQADFNAATPVAPPVVPAAGGTPATYTITGLPADTFIFPAIEYIDAVGNNSGLSNLPVCKTLDLVPPGQVTDLQILSIVGTVVTVRWTNSGDNGNVGTATTTDIRYRTNGCLALAVADFVGPAVAPIVNPVGEPAPTAAGTVQTFTFDVGAPFTSFDVALVQYDEVPLRSPVSNQTVCGATGAPSWTGSAPGADTGGGISATLANSVTPCLAVNPVTGLPGVAWTDLDTTNGDTEIFFREQQGLAFVQFAGSASTVGAASGLSNNATASQFPSLAYAPALAPNAGLPVVAWQDAADGDPEIYVRRFQAGAWAQLAGSATTGGVSNNGTTSTDPSVAINPVTGQPGVAWVDFQLGDFEIFFREFDGAAWQQFVSSGAGQGLSNNGGRSLTPSLTYDATGRPIVAWSDDTGGNEEIYVRRLNAARTAWEELAGSGSGGGISRSPLPSRNPSVQVDGNGNPCVVWQETIADGTTEIFGRRFDGVAWVDFGPGSATGGGISITSMNSLTPSLSSQAPSNPNIFLCMWADASDPQGDFEIYAKLFDNGGWREIGTFSARFGGVSNNATQSLLPSCGLSAGRAYVAWQDFSNANYEVLVRSLQLFGPVSDSPQEFVVGGGVGGRGEYRVFGNGTTLPPYLPLNLRAVAFGAAYNNTVGTLHPACGDLDGDGLDEVVVGQGSFPGGNGGFVAVIRDHTGRFDQLAMLRFPWTAYNNANGAIYPACGDIDGDGRDEIIMGQGSFVGGGYAAIFEDQVAGFPFVRFFRSGLTAYNSSNGEIHPACGDVDADGVDEIVIGFGKGGAGLVQVRDDLAHSLTSLASIAYPTAAYNTANGTTWPACGNLVGGRGAEIVVGPGKGGLGQVYIYGDTAAGYSRVGSLSFPWGVYDNQQGEVRPAVGNLDADLALEVVGGTGPFPGVATGGFLFVFDNVTTGSPGGRFVRYVNSNATYNSANGETFPAVGQIR